LVSAQAKADPANPAPMIATLEGMTLLTHQRIHILGSNAIQPIKSINLLQIKRVNNESFESQAIRRPRLPIARQ
jgi:hypothetical protein